jgi:hypothetical protein
MVAGWLAIAAGMVGLIDGTMGSLILEEQIVR